MSKYYNPNAYLSKIFWFQNEPMEATLSRVTGNVYVARLYDRKPFNLSLSENEIRELFHE